LAVEDLGDVVGSREPRLVGGASINRNHDILDHRFSPAVARFEMP
jgi:hypothetical protein